MNPRRSRARASERAGSRRQEQAASGGKRQSLWQRHGAAVAQRATAAIRRSQNLAPEGFPGACCSSVDEVKGVAHGSFSGCRALLLDLTGRVSDVLQRAPEITAPAQISPLAFAVAISFWLQQSALIPLSLKRSTKLPANCAKQGNTQQTQLQIQACPAALHHLVVC